MSIPSPNLVKNINERRALQAIIAGKKAPSGSITDLSLRRVINAFNKNGAIPGVRDIKDKEAQRIVNHLREQI